MIDLSLSLEDAAPQPLLRPGRKLIGSVSVSCSEPTRCDALTVSLEWRATGLACEVSDAPETQHVFQGAWVGGDRAEYAFELDVPSGPYSYEGELVQVRWYVVVRADLPRSQDEVLEVPVTLRPWTRDALAELEDGEPATLRNDAFSPGGTLVTPTEVFGSEGSRNRRLIAVGAALVALGVLGGVLSLGGVLDDVGVLAAGGVFGAWLLGKGLVRKRSTGKLGGEPEVTLSPERVELGGRVAAKVRASPPRTVALERAHAVLRCAEGVVRPTEDRLRRRTLTVYEERLELAAPETTLEPERDRVLGVEFDLPADAPSSFVSDAIDVRWTLELEVKPQGAAPWTREIALVVRPPGLETLRAAGALGPGSS